MTRVTVLWNALPDDDKEAVYHALRAALRDDGAFCHAIVADAEPAPEQDDSGHCGDCGTWTPHLRAFQVEQNGGTVVHWLDTLCWAARTATAARDQAGPDEPPDGAP